MNNEFDSVNYSGEVLVNFFYTDDDVAKALFKIHRGDDDYMEIILRRTESDKHYMKTGKNQPPNLSSLYNP